MAWLHDHLDYPEYRIRTEILHALCRSGYQAPAADAPHVLGQLKAEAALCAGVLAAQADLGSGDAVGLLQSALGEVMAQCRTRVFYLLSFLYDRRSVLQARDNLSLASADRRAYALELLDALVSSDLKRLVLALLSDVPPGQRAHPIHALFPQQPFCRLARLEELISDPPAGLGAWVRACALYAAGRLPADALATAVADSMHAPAPVVRETAIWAAARLDAGGVGTGVPCQESSCEGEKTMLTTVEKVIALKRAAVFAEVPEETLAELAPCLEEVEYGAGQAIFRKGDLGDCLFLVAGGSVRVHDGDRTLDVLSAGQVLGEMAVLDSEPRSASATARVDSLLLRLDQEALYEAMEERVEVARGVIRMLSGRLRARMADLSVLHPQQER